MLFLLLPAKVSKYLLIRNSFFLSLIPPKQQADQKMVNGEQRLNGMSNGHAVSSSEEHKHKSSSSSHHKSSSKDKYKDRERDKDRDKDRDKHKDRSKDHKSSSSKSSHR